jgi:hypothetical protein
LNKVMVRIVAIVASWRWKGAEHPPSAAASLYQQPLHPVLPRSLLPPESVYVPGPRAQYGVPAQGKECFSTGRARSARDQSRSPPILEDYRLRSTYMPDLPSRVGGWSTLAHWISPVSL